MESMSSLQANSARNISRGKDAAERGADTNVKCFHYTHLLNHQ